MRERGLEDVLTECSWSRMMKHKLVRIAIGVLAAFNALSAIGGGIVILHGTYQDGVLIKREGEVSFRWNGSKTRRSAIIPFPRLS